MLITELYSFFLNSQGISTDTRNIKKDSIFFALKGANFNGNQFADQALAAGAKYAVVDEAQYSTSERHLLVEDSLVALQNLATHHRRTFQIPMIAITGTNGKTTTKELIACVLKQKYITHYTQGNLNNHIGVPLTLLAMPRETQIAVIEMGANKIGDIAELCSIAEPNFGLITNIGKAHLEGFGSYEGVLIAKSQMYDFLLKTKGIPFINTKQLPLKNMAKRFPNAILYNSDGDFFYAKMLEASPEIIFENENKNIIKTSLIGSYNFDNIATALCIGKYFGVEMAKAEKAVAEYVPTNNRSQVITKGSNTLIMDAYNANPSSMKAALENFNGIKADKKTVILGDMFELGKEAKEEHQSIVNLAENLNFNQILLCGQNFSGCALNKALAFSTKNDLMTFIRLHKIEEHTILLKGSRGMGLEALLEVF